MLAQRRRRSKVNKPQKPNSADQTPAGPDPTNNGLNHPQVEPTTLKSQDGSRFSVIANLEEDFHEEASPIGNEAQTQRIQDPTKGKVALHSHATNQWESSTPKKTNGSLRNKENKAPKDDKLNKTKKQHQGNYSGIKEPLAGAKNTAINPKTVHGTSTPKPMVSSDARPHSQKSSTSQTLVEKVKKQEEPINAPTTSGTAPSFTAPNSCHVPRGSTAMDSRGVDADNSQSAVDHPDGVPKNPVESMEVDKATSARDHGVGSTAH